MKRHQLFAGLTAMGLALLLLGPLFSSIAQEGSRRGTLVSLDGPVTPASAEYLVREIGAASDRGEEVVIMEIDTPGGLVDSMQDIVQAILASETPVVTYVFPQGARSASAGLYIMYGSHVAAMAPATNTGSATPIQMGGDPGGSDPIPASEDSEDGSEESAPPADISNDASMRGKVIEDSVAYIRALAEERGRNADWAEKAVRPPSASITVDEALELGVIEIKAEDLDDLLRQLDGRTVKVPSGEKTLNTEGLVLERVEPQLWEKILGFIADPNVAAILFTLGTTGLIVELWNPGSIFPGTIGAVSLLMAFYAFSVLPSNGLALGLMIVGMALIVVEAFSPSFGLAGGAGLLIFGGGLYFLFPDEFRIEPALIIGLLAGAAILLGSIFWALVTSRSHGPLIGQEAIRKREGRVDSWDNEKGEGYVIVDGERWRARSKEPLSDDDRIKVQDIDGIVLVVKRAQGQGMMSRFTQGRSPA